jgi:hypothetical protein
MMPDATPIQAALPLSEHSSGLSHQDYWQLLLYRIAAYTTFNLLDDPALLALAFC